MIAEPDPGAQREVAAERGPDAQPEVAAGPGLGAQPEVAAGPGTGAQPGVAAGPDPVAPPEVAAAPGPVAPPEASTAPPPGPLRSSLADLDPPLPRDAEAHLDLLFDLLVRSRRAGITGFRSADALARHYFREALELRPFVEGCGRVLDVGSGGGTPALPLATVLGGQQWILLEPRRTAAAFLELAAGRLGLASRVRIVRRRLDDYLGSDDGIATVGSVPAVTLRAVRLREAEWRGLAEALPAGAVVIWPTSREARDRADLPAGLFDEEIRPAERGIVWIGRPRTGVRPDVSRETSRGGAGP